jgi:hypothetical protein
MQVSPSSGFITNVRSTLRQGLSDAAQGTSARLAASQKTAGDPLDTGTPPIAAGADSFDRTVTTTTDEITITVNVTRAQKGGLAPDPAGGSDPTEAGETVQLEITTIDDSLSGKQTKIVVDPVEAANPNVSASEIAGIESNLIDGSGVYAGNVSINDQRTVTQKVDQTLLEPDAAGTLQSVETSSSQTVTADYSADEKSLQTFDATTGTADSASTVASSLLKTFSSTDWLGANIPGLHVSAQA